MVLTGLRPLLPIVVTNTTAQLSVQASSPLTMTYLVATGPAAVSYSPSGTTAAQNTAHSLQAGNYSFTVTIKEHQQSHHNQAT